MRGALAEVLALLQAPEGAAVQQVLRVPGKTVALLQEILAKEAAAAADPMRGHPLPAEPLVLIRAAPVALARGEPAAVQAELPKVRMVQRPLQGRAPAAEEGLAQMVPATPAAAPQEQ